jgi:hypothetical protein
LSRCGLLHVPDAIVLDQARKKIGLSIDQLWMRYFELGGKADPLELEAILGGILKPEAYQFNVIAHALNECYMERCENHPVAYADSAGSGPT